jgi:hypothetical protein
MELLEAQLSQVQYYTKLKVSLGTSESHNVYML